LGVSGFFGLDLFGLGDEVGLGVSGFFGLDLFGLGFGPFGLGDEVGLCVSGFFGFGLFGLGDEVGLGCLFRLGLVRQFLRLGFVGLLGLGLDLVREFGICGLGVGFFD